ncbi:esterase-like activity of phytase family protein [Sphingomonas sp. AX6]|uniref:esterase-like activity of phytase family protein n=1 Tax=Sphingomonas sp. AX6 TaxID=2653171 RepID=UPI0012EF6208|nr:esterase-like activity of phytase family protein [Sphingomonas sp. AX6]VXC82032.1 conserved hypothetical protein [Sphingomonas sp. AX6]
MRRAWLSPFLILSLVPGWSGAERLPLLTRDARIDVRHLTQLAADQAQKRIGALEYLGGVALKSPDPAFGGFSGLHVEDDRFLLLSDGGAVVRFTMGDDWRIREASFGDLTQGPRTGWEKRDRDSESIVVDPDTGTHWVAYESANAIWRYDETLTRATGQQRPPAMRRWSRSGGPEAMARLSDGRFVVLSESARRGAPEATYRAVTFDRDPVDPRARTLRFFYRPPTGFRATAADALPDDRIIVVNRRVVWPDGFEAVITILDPAEIRSGEVVGGRIVARFGGALWSGFGRDNFEAVSVASEGDDTIIWLATDDNLQWPQRSLLLKFRLID